MSQRKVSAEIRWRSVKIDRGPFGETRVHGDQALQRQQRTGITTDLQVFIWAGILFRIKCRKVVKIKSSKVNNYDKLLYTTNSNKA